MAKFNLSQHPIPNIYRYRYALIHYGIQIIHIKSKKMFCNWSLLTTGNTNHTYKQKKWVFNWSLLATGYLIGKEHGLIGCTNFFLATFSRRFHMASRLDLVSSFLHSSSLNFDKHSSKNSGSASEKISSVLLCFFPMKGI